MLDLGSGPSHQALKLQRLGLDVVCLDIAPSMVEACKRKGLDPHKGSATHLPFPDSSFDGLWAVSSLLHLTKEEMEQALAEIGRVLRKGGVW